MDSQTPPRAQTTTPHFPRRYIMRSVLRFLIGRLLFILTKFEVNGREHLPKSGPILVVANHFHFADPAFLIYASRRHMEFIAGRQAPNAPKVVTIFPKLWGVLRAFRGGYSRSTLDGALSVLGQGRAVALFPEGGAWAQVLRPARPGAAFLAVESGVQIVPIGIVGAEDVLRRGRKKLTINIGPPLGPFTVSGAGKARRAEIDAIGETIMRAIAAQIPSEQRGVFSNNEAIRDAAQDVAAFPFAQKHMRGK